MVGTEGATDGGALLCVNELTKIAAERSCGAREAVELMGRLAEAHAIPNPNPSP